MRQKFYECPHRRAILHFGIPVKIYSPKNNLVPPSPNTTRFARRKFQIILEMFVMISAKFTKRQWEQRATVWILRPVSMLSLEKTFSNDRDYIKTTLQQSLWNAVIATIAEEWFPYDHNDFWTFFPAKAAIITIIWKPAFRRRIWASKIYHFLVWYVILLWHSTELL